MNYNRIQMLKEEIKKSPEDPFFIYALALEYKDEDQEKCLELLEECYEKFPEYLPNYYQLAELLGEFERKERALKIYDEGIKIAQSKNEYKTLAELQNARQNLLFED